MIFQIPKACMKVFKALLKERGVKLTASPFRTEAWRGMAKDDLLIIYKADGELHDVFCGDSKLGEQLEEQTALAYKIKEMK